MHKLSASPAAPPAVTVHAIKAGCAGCSMHQLCLPMGLDEDDMVRLDQVIGRRRRVARDEQITGFQMAGELLGMEAISGERYLCDAVALDDCEVCEIPFPALEGLFGEVPNLLRHFHRIMSQEITREQNVMLLLGNMRAEQRFAVFLVNLAARYAARGYSATQFQLRMSREDIGNYLGLTIESISRLLARFKKLGLLRVEKRGITLLDPPRLKAMAAGTTACSPLS
jgi:CRP/FNR family transcriptional regulator